MQAAHPACLERDNPQEQCRHYRIERRFCGERSARELVRDLLRAHSGG